VLVEVAEVITTILVLVLLLYLMEVVQHQEIQAIVDIQVLVTHTVDKIVMANKLGYK
jgi:hypothetical protein